MPGRKIARRSGFRTFPGVDHDNPFRVLNRPGIDGERFCPALIGKRIDESSKAGSFSMTLIRPDKDCSGLERMDFHGCFPSFRRIDIGDELKGRRWEIMTCN